jgi:ABC-type glutathione transport system ATPase component
MRDMPNRLAVIRELTVNYVPEGGPRIVALDNVSLAIEAGQIVGVTGESGSGKSTLAAAMLRLLPQSAVCRGSICFEKQELLEMGERELRSLRGAQISLVPQDPAVCLNPVIKVGEQIAEVLRAHLKMTSGQRKNHALDLLREVGFEDTKQIYGLYPHQLSGGQRQRVVIAQAMACRPKLVVADEPTSKLDAPAQAHILQLLINLARQNDTAMLLITHDPAILAALADRVAVMYAGRIVEEGTTEDVCRNPLHPYTQALW